MTHYDPLVEFLNSQPSDNNYVIDEPKLKLFRVWVTRKWIHSNGYQTRTFRSLIESTDPWEAVREILIIHKISTSERHVDIGPGTVDDHQVKVGSPSNDDVHYFKLYTWTK